MHSEIIDSTFRGLRTYGDGCGVIPCKLTAHSMGCDGSGVGGSMELLKAFKSPFSSRAKKILLSTYPKILFRFNFLRLP
jgi:hypothetical protein